MKSIAIRVLFVCIHNSARSQMAEAFLNEIGGNRFHAESAGLNPGLLNPVVIDVMKDAGIDISDNKTKSVYDLLSKNKTYDYVITVCDEANAEQCPLFPGPSIRLHWGFPDPSQCEGDPHEIFEQTMKIRDTIRIKIINWLKKVERNG
jgi:arsenate reductase (thioredoxin)